MVKVPDIETEYLVSLGTFKISAVNYRYAVDKVLEILRDPNPPHYAIKVKQEGGIDNYCHYGINVEIGDPGWDSATTINSFEPSARGD